MEIKQFTYRKPNESELTPLNLSDITTIYLHHTSNYNGIFKDTDYHLDSKKWTWNGYGYYLDDNNIWEVRGFKFMNAGVSGYNHCSVNIVCKGNYDTNELSRKYIDRLKWLIKELIPQLPSLKYIRPHRHDYPTTCPGYKFPLHEFNLTNLKKELEGESMLSKELSQKIADLEQRIVKVEELYVELAKSLKKETDRVSDGFKKFQPIFSWFRTKK